MEAIQAAIDAGYSAIVIDSISHEWLWCNELVNSMPGNSFQNWGKVKTLHHNKFMEFILQSPIHVFATARGKDKWTTEDKNGRMAPKKVGEGAVASDDTEYNYTVSFNLQQDTNVAVCSKDNTHIFEGRYDKLTEKDGEKLYDWANTGEVKVEKKPTFEPVVDDTESIETVISDITKLFKSKLDAGEDKNKLYDIVKSVAGTKNFTAIKDISVAKKVYDALS